jgi:hypothetical protein
MFETLPAFDWFQQNHRAIQEKIVSPKLRLSLSPGGYTMKKMQRLTLRLATLLAMAALVQTSPIPPRAWTLDSAALEPAALPAGTTPLHPPARADLDGDGMAETLTLSDGRLALLSAGQTIWESPPNWNVLQAAFTSLNDDALPEATLLVWRAFRPWPVDEFLPYGGRIADFHDRAGNSCHIILIGRIRGRLGEVWAGSALAEPVTAFAAADLNGDAAQELITLEGRYAGVGSGPARALKVWEWNGFGFTLVSSVNGSFSALALARQEDGQILILTP